MTKYDESTLPRWAQATLASLRAENARAQRDTVRLNTLAARLDKHGQIDLAAHTNGYEATLWLRMYVTSYRRPGATIRDVLDSL